MRIITCLKKEKLLKGANSQRSKPDGIFEVLKQKELIGAGGC